MWVDVVGEALPVHADASLDAPVIGTVTVGDVVFVHPTAPTVNDRFYWYDIQASPTLRGWVTLVNEEAYQLSLEGATATTEWCAVPSDRVYPVAEYEPKPFIALGGVPIPSSLFSAAALGAADIAWADQTATVCAVLALVDGAVASTTFLADFETCAKPVSGAYGWGLDYGGRVVGPGGEDQGPRYVLVSDAVLGYSQMYAELQNADEVAQLAGAGSSFSDRTACIRMNVTGGIVDTEIATTIGADVCAQVVSVHPESVVLLGISPWDDISHIEFVRHIGSQIDPAIQEGTTLGIALETDGGVDAPIRMRPVAVDGCG
jgi:hypothetical protein